MSTTLRGGSHYVVTDMFTGAETSTMIISSFCFGVLTVLASVTAFFLLRNRVNLNRPSMYFQIISTATLYVSTCVFFAISIPLSSNLYAWKTAPLRSPSHTLPTTKWGEGPQLRVQWLIFMGTATINIVVGDTIVLWRVCAVWPKNYYVRTACVIILAATLALGCVATYLMGSPDVGIFVNGGTQMNELNRFWTACMFLSLASNVTATSLIGYKFWAHRRTLKDLSSKSALNSRTRTLLALLVESGAGYSVLWFFAAVTELYLSSRDRLHSTPRWFLCVVDVFTRGALTYLIAAYPMLIIVIVNLTRSHNGEEDRPGATRSPSLRFFDPEHGGWRSTVVRSAVEVTESGPGAGGNVKHEGVGLQGKAVRDTLPSRPKSALW